MQIKVYKLIVGLLFLSHLTVAQNFYKDIIPRVNNLYIGVGPSFMYADNGGGLRNSQFKIRPATTIAYGRKINSFLELKGSFGYQMLESQDPGYYNDEVLRRWIEAGQAVGMKGNGYYFDLMPAFNLPVERHIDRKNVNIYAGIGLGVMLVRKEEVKIINNVPTVEKKTLSLAYIPIRGGISYRIGPHSDLALEGTMMATFSDEIDGNVGFNRFNDHLFQGQIVFKRYLSPFPFWNKYLN
ncbi:MAG TPA: hypothetical protein VKX33_04710 [Cyclobacteriaceae bacterium]|nr:hypothetical protein [Cyclobacteriaceae bacterium]